MASVASVASVGIPYHAIEPLYEQQGISLWLQLQKELSPDYEVLYLSQKLRKVISHPSELMAAA